MENLVPADQNNNHTTDWCILFTPDGIKYLLLEHYYSIWEFILWESFNWPVMLGKNEPLAESKPTLAQYISMDLTRFFTIICDIVIGYLPVTHLYPQINSKPTTHRSLIAWGTIFTKNNIHYYWFLPVIKFVTGFFTIIGTLSFVHIDFKRKTNLSSCPTDWFLAHLLIATVVCGISKRDHTIEQILHEFQVVFGRLRHL